MRQHSTGEDETAVTELTPIRSVTGVKEHVPVQIRAALKTEGTHGADVRPIFPIVGLLACVML